MDTLIALTYLLQDCIKLIICACFSFWFVQWTVIATVSVSVCDKIAYHAVATC